MKGFVAITQTKMESMSPSSNMLLIMQQKTVFPFPSAATSQLGAQEFAALPHTEKTSAMKGGIFFPKSEDRNHILKNVFGNKSVCSVLKSLHMLLIRSQF